MGKDGDKNNQEIVQTVGWAMCPNPTPGNNTEMRVSDVKGIG